MGEQRIRRRIVVTGRVQGVGFRAHTRQLALRLGAHGWVRNRPDGSVEAIVEGEPRAVEAMLAVLHQGPSWAHVDRLDQSSESPEGLHGFEIR